MVYKELKTTLKTHTKSTKTSVNQIQLHIEGDIYAHAGGTVSTSYHNFETGLDKIIVNFKTSDGKTHSSSIGTYDSAGSRQWGWSGASARDSVNHYIYLNIPTTQNPTDILSTLSLTFIYHKSNHYGDKDWANGSINIRKISQQNNNSGNWITLSKSWTDVTGHDIGSKLSSTHSLSISPIYTGKSNYYNITKLKYKQIYMSYYDLQTKNYSQQELKKFVNLMWSGQTIGQNQIHYSSIKLDKANKQLIVMFSKIDGFQPNVSIMGDSIRIPITIINLDYLFRVSLMSNSYIQHQANGDTRYWTSKPKTKIKLSEDYLKALKLKFCIKEIIAKINKDSWGFISGDKQIAISKAKSLSLNLENYEDVRIAYRNSHDQNILNQLLTDSTLKKYLPNFDNSSYEDYLNVFKSMTFEFDYGVSNSITQTITFNDLALGKDLFLPDAEITTNPGRIKWNANISNAIDKFTV